MRTGATGSGSCWRGDPGFRYWPPSLKAEAYEPGKVWSARRWVEIASHQAGELSKGPHLVPTLALYALIDLGHPVPRRMWERRLRGYRAIGYFLISGQ